MLLPRWFHRTRSLFKKAGAAPVGPLLIDELRRSISKHFISRLYQPLFEMIGICSIGLLVLSTLTVYATPSTLYANGKQDHENLSDEDVANYFRNKFETEDVKPSMVLEYLVKLMGSEKSGSSIATTS